MRRKIIIAGLMIAAGGMVLSFTFAILGSHGHVLPTTEVKMVLQENPRGLGCVQYSCTVVVEAKLPDGSIKVIQASAYEYKDQVVSRLVAKDGRVFLDKRYIPTVELPMKPPYKVASWLCLGLAVLGGCLFAATVAGSKDSSISAHLDDGKAIPA